ncbi:phenylacetate--CoA ligase family protein [Nocardia sp. CDC153]|uniref:phenylacetate--CoA ligase family protein n=1 Tax=Nocardia sp. CDC153 TaxID=3112167 RepID=UPI002DC02D07|nr:phenylacetate--CoA ligase family protein [Nocardia sp. CDC153]MEC3955852.1 phenylacetate--CoA ligase family protein [Nocardia sp. CDC153]
MTLKYQLRRTHPQRSRLHKRLRELEHADADAIRAYQEQRLRALVCIAARRSPFYREFFRTSGVDPRSIRTLDDLTRLPLLSRQDLAERSDDFRTLPRWLMRSARSGGTSGVPIECHRTLGSAMFEVAALERQWSWFGVSPNARRVILRGNTFATDGKRPTLTVPGARQLLVSSYHLTPDRVDVIAEDIRRFGPDVVEGWPSSIALLAALLRDRDIRIPVRAVITSSEVMAPGQRAVIARVFDAPIVDHYGQTERAAMAGVCEAGGYHVFPHYGIVELLPVPDAPDRWEIVGTSLQNKGFPLFRYRTGDEVRPATPGPCPCGRAFPLLGVVDGRVEDTFVSADGRPLPLPSSIVDDLTGLREAQIAQLRPGVFELRVVPGTGFSEARTTAHARRNIARQFGSGQELRVRVFDVLPRPASGKLKTAVVEPGSSVKPRSTTDETPLRRPTIPGQRT